MTARLGTMNPATSGTLTLLFTDIEGSTRLLANSAAFYDEILNTHRSTLRTTFQSFGGAEVETEGDSFFVVFNRAIDAVKAAVQVQLQLDAVKWPDDPVRIRVGIHTGDVEVGPSGYIGLAVHQAQRVCSAAHGGQVLISGATKQVVEHSLPPEVSLKDLGHHRLKDLGLPVQLFQVMSPGLIEQLPPPRTLESLRHNLPVQLTSFVGRTEELSELRSLIGSNRHLTVCGPGGVGKTRLALQAVAEETQDFPDGLWWVDLSATTDPSLLTAAIARGLGVRDDVSKPDPGTDTVIADDPQLARLIDHLTAARSVVILDNCEHMVEQVAQLCLTILQRCPQVQVITTSREPLGIAGELVWRPEPLALPPELDDDPTSYDSVRLFYERARLKVPAFEATSEEALVAAEICRTLDGLPLAIELAAPLVTSLSLQQILDRLNDRFRLLRAADRFPTPGRQNALSATLDWSYDLLTEPERELFTRLWIFKGDFGLEVAEQVCSSGPVEQNEVFQLLSRLVEKSLVNREGRDGIVRFRLLETVREYSREKFGFGDAQLPTDKSFMFVREGEVWAVGAGSSIIRMRDSKGMRHLHKLLSSPEREFSAIDLAGVTVIQTDTGDVIDSRARQNYRRRMEELQQEIEDADSMSDIERASKVRQEFDALAEQLNVAFGLGGRSRTSGSTAERARVATTKAIRSAIERIAEQHPPVGEHLQRAVGTGNYCVYKPEPDVSWTL